MEDMGRILLHTCCAPCATTCTERLLSSGYDAVLFFSNSNIFPHDEYEKRLDNARKLCSILGIDLREDGYDHEAWLRHIVGLEDEPERGRRCMKCFEYNLGRTAAEADLLLFPSFTTTLSVSRYKSSRMIFEAGRAYPAFMPMDFKKQNGYSRSIELSRLFGLYRQRYCGCEFSMQGAGRLTG